MNSRKTVHILSHTHWDREWYLNSQYTNEWLVPFFDNLFKMLEKEPAYKFILDGQLSMIDDYFSQIQAQGKSVYDQKKKIKQYVKQGRLVIGPYFLQPDWQLVSGEALVRNLMLGQKMAAELGGGMKVGWLLDNFGQISQTAQIHAQTGLRGLYVWRGIYMEPDQITTEFSWVSPDGTALPSIYMINSYRNAMRLASNPSILNRRVSDEVERMAYFNLTSHVLLMNGYDQDLEPDDVQPLISSGQADTLSYRMVQSTPEEYLDAVLSEAPQLPALEGAQYVGRYISVFPGVMSARMYLKQQNDLSQRTLERVAEPLSTMNYLLGGEYGSSLLEQCWKLLLKNQPHDSICGVSIDLVHTDMEYRHAIIQQYAAQQIEKTLATLCAHIHTAGTAGEQALVVFNPSTQPRSGVIGLRERSLYVQAVPALGWKTLNPIESETAGDVRADERTAENSWLELFIHPDGSFDVFHKQTGRQYKNLGVFEDKGDAGDLYNYSWPNTDSIYSTRGCPARIQLIENSPVCAEFRIELVLQAPEGLSDDKKSRSRRLIQLPIVTHIRLEAYSEYVKVQTWLKNTAKNHVLRVLFPTQLETDISYGGSPFDVTPHPIRSGDFDETHLPAHVRAVIIGAREPNSNSFYLGQGFSELNDGKAGLAVLTRGLPEYEVTGAENSIALTLLRGVSVIAGEINTRLGDAGPNILTPDAQCLREFCFEYAVYPHAGDVDCGKVAETADLYNQKLLIVETTVHNGSLPAQSGLLEKRNGSAIITAVKKAEKSDGIILRFYNPTGVESNAEFQFELPVLGAWTTDLMENRIGQVEVSGQKYAQISIPPRRIITMLVEISRSSLPVANIADAFLIDSPQHEEFPNYQSVLPVSEAELFAELSRAALLSERKDQVLFRRSALEAELSAILARCRFEEQKIYKLGYQLNDARVKRRLYDYIAAYAGNDEA